MFSSSQRDREREEKEKRKREAERKSKETGNGEGREREKRQDNTKKRKVSQWQKQKSICSSSGLASVSHSAKLAPHVLNTPNHLHASRVRPTFLLPFNSPIFLFLINSPSRRPFLFAVCASPKTNSPFRDAWSLGWTAGPFPTFRLTSTRERREKRLTGGRKKKGEERRKGEREEERRNAGWSGK